MDLLSQATQHSANLVTGIYIIAAVLFILSISSLSQQQTAESGNWYGIVGMFLAISATLYAANTDNMAIVAGAMLIGALIGIRLALKVEMTQMPELVAILHSFVGLAAVMVGFNSYFEHGPLIGVMLNIHLIEVFLGIFIGAVTFTGSVVAFAKLRGIVNSAALMLPHRHKLNLIAVLACVILMVLFVMEAGKDANKLYVMTIIALVFGWHLVSSIGGADMPVVVSMLNSYSGWAAAAAGFLLSNDLLIVTGALVGSSGAILSYIMCKAMNRSFISVIAGGFGQDATSVGSGEAQGEYISVQAEQVASMLQEAKKIMITPGYGMAVAQAQYPIYQLCQQLKDKGIRVCFGIHPVAGRLPGHMNVLLAEAKVPYDIVLEMEEVNQEMEEFDLVLVVGANDTVNPAALEDPNSPIAGMPVVEVWRAKNVIISKRTMNTGYAGVQNPLFFKENSQLLFGDAKESIEAISKAL